MVYIWLPVIMNTLPNNSPEFSSLGGGREGNSNVAKP